MSNSSPDNHKPFLTLLALFAFLVILVGFNMHHFWGGPEKFDWQNLGARADLFAGIVSPFLSLLAFGGVLYTINLQRQDFKLQRKDLAETQADARRQQDALARQGFEATFFRMLSLHQEILNSIDLILSKPEGTVRGRDCFRTFRARLYRRYQEQLKLGKSEAEAIRLGYAEFWKRDNQELGHYFRYLFNICRFVHQAHIPTLPGEVTKPSAKYRYMRILRAQLSDYELLLLFYNMHGEYGQDFKPYSAEYHLLDNMPPNLAFALAHLEVAEGMGRIGKFGEGED